MKRIGDRGKSTAEQWKAIKADISLNTSKKNLLFVVVFAVAFEITQQKWRFDCNLCLLLSFLILHFIFIASLLLLDAFFHEKE